MAIPPPKTVPMAPEATAGSLDFWKTERFKSFMERTMRRYIGSRPYAIVADERSGAYMQFSPLRRITIGAHFPDALAPAALQLPQRWGSVVLDRPGLLRAYLLRAVIGHECLHVLLTQPLQRKDYTGSYHAALTNAGEDGRIEAWARHYSALLATDITELGTRMWAGDWAMTGDWALDVFNMVLFSRWNELRGEDKKEISFGDPEKDALWGAQILPLARAMWRAPNTRTVRDVAAQIMEVAGIDGTQKDPDRAVRGGPDLDAAPSGERSLFDRPDHEGDTPPESGKGAPAAPLDTDAADTLLGSAELDCDPSGGLLWARSYTELQDAVFPLVLEWERRLRAPDPAALPKRHKARGRFDASGYVRSHGALPFVLPHAAPGTSPRALAFGVVIDTSGSMGRRPQFDERSKVINPGWDDPQDGWPLPSCKRATLALERYCARNAVPLAIAACSNDVRFVHPGHWEGRKLANPVQWIKRLATPASMEGPRALLSGLYAVGGVESASKGLLAMARELLPCPRDLKVLLYLHDGEPVDEQFADPSDLTSYHPVRETALRLRAQGLIVLGVYIGDDPQALEAIFSPEWTIIVADHTLLPERLGLLLAQLRLGE